MTDQLIDGLRYVRLHNGRLLTVGQFAGRGISHPHLPDANTGSLCLACYGWADDVRHLAMATGPTTGIGGFPAGRHA